MVQEDPQSKYTFNSERDAPESELCREGDKLSRKCIMVRSPRLAACMEAELRMQYRFICYDFFFSKLYLGYALYQADD